MKYLPITALLLLLSNAHLFSAHPKLAPDLGQRPASGSAGVMVRCKIKPGAQHHGNVVWGDSILLVSNVVWGDYITSVESVILPLHGQN
jgi:hypothetical protein